MGASDQIAKSGSKRPGLKIAAVAGIGTAAAYVAWCLLKVIEFRDVVPRWDMIGVEWFIDVRFLHDPSLFTAFAFHDNEHRPVFPLYIFLADHVFFGSHELSLVICSLVTVAGIAFITARRIGGAIQDPARRLAFWLLVPCVLLWPGQIENLVFPKQLHELLCIVLTCLVFDLAVQLDGRVGMGSSRSNLLRASAIAVLNFVAAFSFGWGVLATILVALFAVIRRWELVPAGLVVLGAVVTICTYVLVWATPSEQQGVFELARLLLRLVAYASIFVGAPIGASLASLGESSHFQCGVAGVLGLAGLALAACSMGPLIGPRELPKESAAGRNYARLMVAFVAMCAAVTAVGRVRFGLSQAVESQRYFILPCLFWLSLPVLLPALPVIGRWTRWLGWPAMLAGFGGILATTPHFIDWMADRMLWTRIGAIAAVMGEDHIPAPPRLYPTPLQLHIVFDDYAHRGVSVYADRWPHWLGQRIEDLAPRATDCQGYVDRILPIPGSANREIIGWIFDVARREAPPWVALVDSQRRVSGLATFGMQRDDVALAMKSRAARRAGFDGFMLDQGPAIWWIYGWFADNSWCRVRVRG